MICPHCKKKIEHGASAEVVARIKELKREKYSLREMEKILFSEGMIISFGSIARVLREKK